MKAYDESKSILLPDGTLLQVGGWFESYPPQPADLHVIPHLYQSFPIEEIAHLLNAVIAEKDG